jgi:hypothetical protein
VELACARYRGDGWTVRNVSRRNDETEGTPYDLRCTKDGEVRHVEVKGTTGSGETVLVSANERRHAESPNAGGASFMFVVEKIGLRTEDGEVKAVGGGVRYDGPFVIDDAFFRPTQYRYTVPGAPVGPRDADVDGP